MRFSPIWVARWRALACGLYAATIFAGTLYEGSVALAKGPVKVRRGAAASTEPLPTDAQPTSNPNFSDLRIGTDSVTYEDPEFWPETKQAVWQNNRTGDNWLCSVDPVTGAFIPSTGQQIYLGEGKRIVSRDMPGSFNGPEFGVSRDNGLCIYYTAQDNRGVNQVKRYNISTQENVFITTDRQYHSSGALPSSDPTAPFAATITFNFNSSVAWDPRWRYENQLKTDIPLPNSLLGTSGPRWVPGRMTICTNLADANNVTQLALYDCATRTVRTITSGGTADRSEGSPFYPPEFPGKIGIWCIEGTGIALFVEGQPGGDFVKVKEIPQPTWNGEPLNVWSLEAVAANGKSYCVFGGSPKVRLPWLSENEILVTGLDLDQPIMLTQPDDRRNCLDPEGVVLDGKFFVYYSVIAAFRVNEIHVVTNFLPVEEESSRDHDVLQRRD